MDSLDAGFEETRVHLAIVFSMPLSLVQRLKKEIVNALADMPEVRPVYQRISPGKLRITVERAEQLPVRSNDEQGGQP